MVGTSCMETGSTARISGSGSPTRHRYLRHRPRRRFSKSFLTQGRRLSRSRLSLGSLVSTSRWLLARRSRPVPTARHPRCVPASRPPLQRSTIRRQAWPLGPGREERAMAYDLVIKNGVVIDGSGMPRYRADVGVRHGRIVTIGRVRERAPEGIDWTWTTFPEFLDRVASLPKGINYACYIGHSALRTHVMSERAFEKPAGEDDLRAMERELRDAIRAGAIGFTTSRSPSHETPDRRPVASRLATWEEVRRLVGVMGDMNAGIFELAGEEVGRTSHDPQGLRDYHVRLRDLASPRPRGSARSAVRSEPSRGPPRTNGSSSSTRSRGRTDRWPRSRASAAWTRSRP